MNNGGTPEETLAHIASMVTEMYHAMPGIHAAIRSQGKRIEEHERRIVSVEAKVIAPERHHALDRAPGPTRSSDPAPSSAGELAEAYGLRSGNTGSYKVTPEILDQLAQRLQEADDRYRAMELQRHDMEQQKLGVEQYMGQLRKRFRLIITILGVITTILGILEAMRRLM